MWGIGDGIVRRVDELASTGRLAELDEARAQAAGLVEVARVDGIGPTTTRMLHDRLGIRNLDDLEAAAVGGRLAEIGTFTPKRVEDLLRAIDRARNSRGELRRDLAEKEALPFLETLRALPSVSHVEFGGSMRRKKEIVGDVDLICATTDVNVAAHAFCTHRHVEVVLARGQRCGIRTYTGLQIDVFFCTPEDWGLTLHHYSSGKEHNIALRLLAATRGLKLSEHGIFEHGGAGPRRPGGTEEREVYDALGMQFIPPEMRDNRTAIERALAGTLPVPMTAADLRGDLHTHTFPGMTLDELVAEAARLGREYVAVTDHAKTMDAERQRVQAEAIRKINEKGGVRVLNGIEVDILPDGGIELPARALAGFDWVIGAVHTGYDLPQHAQTERLVRAIESGLIDVLGHPTGRIIGQREGMDLEMQEVVAAAARTDVALELDANVDRLDLSDLHLTMARERGAWIALGSGAHDLAGLARIDMGVDLARRAWLEPQHVLNTRRVGDLLDLIAARRRGA
jgi:DNA polymerase (family 10)